MKFAVILSGCGVFDGTEIGEAICALLAIEEEDVSWEALAPDRQSAKHVDHLTQANASEKRHVLQESARIVRGEIKDIATATVDDYDAVIIPGGFGAMQNLCDFAQADMDYTVFPEVERFLSQAVAKQLPMGFICIAPMLIPRLYQGATFTIGNDADLAVKIQQLGCVHKDCLADDIVIDPVHKIVSTPARMLAENLVDLKAGITKLVQSVVMLARE